jgi:hypothetical protein
MPPLRNLSAGQAARERFCAGRRRDVRAILRGALRLGRAEVLLVSGSMPLMVAAVMAPRTSGFTPKIRPNTAPAKNNSAGATHFPAIIGPTPNWYAREATPVQRSSSASRFYQLTAPLNPANGSRYQPAARLS